MGSEMCIRDRLKRMADTQNVEFVINGNVVEVKNKTD